MNSINQDIATMKVGNGVRFEIIVNGKQSGAPSKWMQVPLFVDSTWEPGGDNEKFEVLKAIRKTYDPHNDSDIRGEQGQTPAQVGRCEGFKELNYRRIGLSSLQIIIVPPVMQYLRLVPSLELEAGIDQHSYGHNR